MASFDNSFEARAFRSGAEPLLSSEIIESQLKALLPSELRQLYDSFSAAIVFDQNIVFPAPGCRFANEEGLISIELILGPTDGDSGILQANNRLKGQIPDDTIAFAELAGGNMLLASALVV